MLEKLLADLIVRKTGSVWNIRKIAGKHCTNTMKHLLIDNCGITSKGGIADQLTKADSRGSSAGSGG